MNYYYKAADFLTNISRFLGVYFLYYYFIVITTPKHAHFQGDTFYQ